MNEETKDDNLGEVLIPDAEFPSLVFRSRYKYFDATDFDGIFTTSFYEDMGRILSNKQKAVLEVIDPTSKYYASLGTPFKFSISSGTLHEFPKVLSINRNNNPLESIFNTVKKLCIYPEHGNWAMYGERDFNTIIIASENLRQRQIVREAFDNYLHSSNIDSFEPDILNLFKNYGI